MKNIVLTTIFLFAAFFYSYGKNRISFFDLKTEYKTTPINIDVKHPGLSWKISATERNTLQDSYQIQAALNLSDLKKGRNLLWDSEKTNSSSSIHIKYAGKELQSMQRVYWRVRVWCGKSASQWSAPTYFETGLYDSPDWKAHWIKSGFKQKEEPDPSPYFRKEFTLNKKINQARAYASSIGLYELFINGKRAGNEYLTPGWTSYNNRIQYQVYDVTDMFVQGKNAVGFILGNGWFRHFRSNDRADSYYDFLAGIVQIEVKYADGSKETLITDNSWKSSAGPILSSTIYDGEIYDARKDLDGWASVGFDDSGWPGTSIVDQSKDILVGAQGEPVIKNEEIKPVKIWKNDKGEVLADMGQNMVGWIKLTVKGDKGTKISLRHAEVLDKNGHFYTENLRAADQLLEYTMKGEGEEVYEPHFTFMGFRYLLIEGFPGMPTADNITGVVVHSRIPVTGNFECSNGLINQLQHNIQWGQKGNFVDVPTDCPQRDERLGWTGDAQAFAPTACFNMYTPAFYKKWLKDLALDQDDQGRIPHVIPNNLGPNSVAACGWADAGLIVPWVVYQYFGDKTILEDQYESMKAWVEYQRRTAGDSYLWNTGRHFGDWLAYATTRSDYPGATTDKDLLATAFFAHSTSLLKQTAEILGKKQDAEAYDQLFAKIKEAFNKEFITPNGRMSSNTQTAYVIALAFNLFHEDKIDDGANRLAEDVKKFGHITTGFLGANLINQVLSEHGYTDLAYMLLNRTAYPSWLYPVTKGATTIWERWDGIKTDGSFQNAGMNSFNHYAYGAVGDWMYRTITGINNTSPGFKTFYIRPELGGDLTYARASFNSMYGMIKSSWEIKGDKINMSVSVPANTISTVYVPASSEHKVKEGGSSLSDAEGIKILGSDNGYVELEVGSGEYNFMIEK
ncbi:MAG: glycoside hydrolase family 78 protein [Cytophagales bacterium]|nr:glycoside hydrolase family 78 protein [Cytophagales bacterium]